MMSTQALISNVHQAFERFEQVLKSNARHWDYRPTPDRWSFAQHSEHLWLAGLSIASILKQEDSFFKAFGATGVAPRSFEVLEAQYFDCIKQGIGANPKQIPHKDFSKTIHESLTQWESLRKKTLDRIENKWSLDDLKNKTISHPALGLINIQELLYFLEFHIDHHIKTLNNEYFNA